MSKRPEIPQTKRSTYRPMNQMNGDFLNQLKRPLCSEFTPEVRGTIKGNVAHCKHKVSLLYKDQAFNVRKIDRSEDAIYNAFLQIYKEKRKLQRETYKKQQEEARAAAQEARERALQNVDKLVLPVDNNKQDIAYKGDTNQEKQEVAKTVDTLKPNAENGDINVVQSPSSKSRPSSKVLEVRKSNLENPIVTERLSTPQDDPVKQGGGANDSKSIVTVETESETSDKPKNKSSPKQKTKKEKSKSPTGKKQHTTVNLTIGSDLKTEIKNNNESLPTVTKVPLLLSNVDETLGHPLVQKHSYRKSFSSMMPVIAEDGPTDGDTVVSLPQPLVQQSYESFFSVQQAVSESEASSRSSPKSINYITSPSGGSPVSQVLLNKRRSKERDRKRKAILDNEYFPLYVRNHNGEIIPSILSFKRKAFSPPSNREKHFQKKMLAAQKEARDAQDHRIEAFFQKLDLDKEATYQRFRKRPPTPEEIKPQKEMGQLGATLEQLAAVFSHRSEPLPSGVDPQSIAAMQYCHYMRNYDLDHPKSDNRDRDHIVETS